MTVLRVALVGCGNISSRHLDATEAINNCSLVAVCDIISERADKAAKKYKARAFYDYDSLIEWGQFDVIHVCTPHYLHAPMAIKAMEKGKHVICEKPLAIRYEDARKMCECADKNNVRLGVCFQNRYNEQSVYLKNLVDSCELGSVIAMKGFVTWDRDESYYNADDWHGTLRKEGGGVIINQCIHTIDLLGWIAGSDIKSVKGSISQKRLEGIVETEDTADALITFENSIQALFYGTLCYSGNSPVFIEIKCERGRIVMYDEISVYRDGMDKETISFERPHGKNDYWGNSHIKLIDDFYSAILSGKSFLLSGEESLRAIKIVDMLYKSAAPEAERG